MRKNAVLAGRNIEMTMDLEMASAAQCSARTPESCSTAGEGLDNEASRCQDGTREIDVWRSLDQIIFVYPHQCCGKVARCGKNLS